MIFVLLIFFNTFYFIKYLADANFRPKILHLRRISGFYRGVWKTLKVA